MAGCGEVESHSLFLNPRQSGKTNQRQPLSQRGETQRCGLGCGLCPTGTSELRTLWRRTRVRSSVMRESAG
jgi:hypothetical protein